MFNGVRSLVLIIVLTLLTTGCATGSTLRTARVLDQGEFEVSGGVAGNQFGHVSQVVIGAYGITDDLEIEGRWEYDYVSITPRLQLLRSETSFVDCLAFFEIGYSGRNHVQCGPGLMLGRRWPYFEPYASYRFRHYSSVPSKDSSSYDFYSGYLGERNVHYVKAGTRIYIPCFWTRERVSPSNWFLGIEMGPTVISKDAFFEWAANIGFDY